jgi:hypothetical protein
MPRESAVTAPNAPGFSGDLFHDSFHAYVGAWSFGVPGLLIRSLVRYVRLIPRRPFPLVGVRSVADGQDSQVRGRLTSL